MDSEEEEVASEEDDTYGVDALETLLQKLKPKSVPDEEAAVPKTSPSVKWKIELPKMQNKTVDDDHQDMVRLHTTYLHTYSYCC